MPLGESPTARALRALEMLQDHRELTASALGERLGVSERAARRYVAILREAGVPVESLRGPYGGYRLGRGARLPPVTFTEAEALGLVMAVLDARPVAAALGKVVRALPGEVGQRAAALRAQAAATPDRWPSATSPTLTRDLAAAASAGRRVEIAYRTESGTEWQGQVEPWAVVVRHGRWYLLCRSLRADAPRAYRIDRVRGVEVLDDTFDPPRDLDAVAALEEHLASGWDFTTRVRFAAPIAEVAALVPATMGRLEPAGAGCLLIGSTNNPQMYAGEWLARLPLAFRVEGGPELQAAMRDLTERLRRSLE